MAFAINPFARSMEDSFIKATLISTHTDAALAQQSSTPPFAALYDYYHPLHLGLMNAYDAWKVQAGASKGKTQTLAGLLKQLSSTEIADWEFDVQQEYRKGTERYTALFPEGRAPFQSGKQMDRIRAVSTLKDALVGDVPLAALHDKVEAFYDLLNGTNTSQKGSVSTTDIRSQAVESAADECTAGLFYVYGGLVQKFYKEPDDIEPYFAVHLIREKEQTAFTGTVAASGRKAIARRTLDPATQIRIVNGGPTALRFFFTMEKDAEPGSLYIIVQPGDDATVSVAAMGTGPYLAVQNESTDGDGSFELVIL